MIFISYRRGDDQGFAGRLYDRLERSFRGQRLFMDVASIPLGQDFVSVLEARVAECDVMLALIGRGWLATTDRLDNPDDFVRIEIASGLAQAKPVIPVLFDDVAMPRREQLPEELKPLVRRQGVRLNHESFRTDSQKLIRALKQALEAASKARQVEIAPTEAQIPDNWFPRARITLDESWTLTAWPDFSVFRDIDAPWCPELVALPSGKFLMGSPDTEKGRYDFEGPQHEVTIERRFAIGRFPVTFEEYDQFCTRTGRQKPDDRGWGRHRRPVINVSWQDAHAYAAWLTRETGRAYRLPSEAEWEYACRAGTRTRYAFGDEITPKDASYNASGHGRTTEVGAYPPNTWGVHDMHGSVREWVEDVWHRGYAGAPTDGSPWANEEEVQPRRVGRGGSSGNYSRYLRSASRRRIAPDYRSNYLGFRVARTLN